MRDLYIEHYCKMEAGSVLLDGVKLFSQEGSVKDFLSGLYYFIGLDYPKFFKMDMLSKATLIAADLLLKETDLIQRESMSVVLCNSTSSSDVDLKFQQSIDSGYYPSPALFVYTLPNISIGEICIKYKIYGESFFFLSPIFDTEFIAPFIESVFEDNRQEYALVGWVENYGGQLQLLLLLISTKESANKFEIQTLNKLSQWKN